MPSRPFVHLHCHSHYSLLDGASKIPALVRRAKALGMPALAITDHGNLYGAVEFLREAKAADLKPILGLEAYVAPGRRTDRTTGGGSGQEYAFHLTLLARNAAGFRNLMRLSSAAFLEGFYYKPRIDKEILERHAEGLICLSGCASAEFSDLILHGKTAEAERLCAWYQKVFGAGELLRRDPGQRHPDPARLRRRGAGHRAADGPAGRRHQRRPLPDAGGRAGPRHPAVHQHGQDRRRPEPDAVRERPVPRPQPRGDVRGDARPRGGAGHLGPDRGPGRGPLQGPQPRPAPVPLVPAPGPEDARGLPPRAVRAGPRATATATTRRPRRASGWSTSWASSTAWGSPRTS